MFVLHVKIRMKPDALPSAERVFCGPFKAAITAQPGFRDAQLLRGKGADDGGGIRIDVRQRGNSGLRAAVARTAAG